MYVSLASNLSRLVSFKQGSIWGFSAQDGLGLDQIHIRLGPAPLTA